MPISITLTHKYEDFQSLESEWMTLLENSKAFGAALTWTWINVWLKHFGEEGELWIMTARDNATGQLLGIAPLFRIHKAPKYGSCYAQIEFIGACHHQENLDFIIKPGHENEIIDAFINTLYQYHSDWDVLYLSGIANPKTNDILTSSVHEWEYLPEKDMVSPFIPLPPNKDEWMMSLSKRRRKKLRQHHRKLDDEFSGNWAIQKVTSQEELEKIFTYLVKFHQTQWETLGKDGAFKRGKRNAYYLELMSTLFSLGQLRFYYLTIAGKPVATLFAYRFGKYAYDFIAGNDYSVTDVPIGHVLTHHNIVEAIQENMEIYLLMWGNQPYKYSFGAEDRILKTYILFNNPKIKIQSHAIQNLKSLKGKIIRKAENLILVDSK